MHRKPTWQTLMEDHYNQIDQLMRQSQSMPDGPARTAIIKECVRLSDLTKDKICQFHVRAIYSHAAFASGEADEMLVTLGWCTGMYDKEPDIFDAAFGQPHIIIDVMSSAFGYVTDFPDISREKIESMLDDFERRHREAGIGLRSVYLERTRNGFWMGDYEVAKVNYKKFLESPTQDGWSEDSERIFRTDFHVHMGDDEAAIAEAEVVIKSKKPADDVSHWIMCFVLAPLIRQNRLAEAKSCHERAYRVCRDNPKYLGIVSRHANYLVAIGDCAKATAMLELHAPWLLETCSEEKKMMFYTVGQKLCVALQASGTSNLRIKFPDSVGPPNEDGNYQCTELAAWFQVEAEKICKRFNDRNGNNSATRSLQEMLDLSPPSVG